jgi:hypothetical protein
MKISEIPDRKQQPYITGFVPTLAGDIPQVSGKLSFSDQLGTIMVRWSVNRDNYKVLPGLYAIGNPAESSDVFVTANYKLSFDHLRKSLDGLNGWILVLDTKGINVWCAAGKGTFGTKELVNRIRLAKLEKIVTHKRIIVPQLGAVGISAHAVKKMTATFQEGSLVTNPAPASENKVNLPLGSLTTGHGFNVLYGPVKAQHIREYINNKYITTREMRKVTFTFAERARLIPVDFVYGKYKLLIAFALFFVLSGLNRNGISFHLAVDRGLSAILYIFLAYIAGIVITPLALPYIPGRSFAFKGFISGMLVFLLLMFFNDQSNNYFETLSWFLIISGISSFLAMNFTGSSTYTSLSGVKKEMKIAIPFQIAFSVIGVILFVLGKIL